MQEEVTAKRGELDAMQNKLVIRSVILFNILLFLWLVRLKKQSTIQFFFLFCRIHWLTESLNNVSKVNCTLPVYHDVEPGPNLLH